jgi:hypothetical protein
MVDFIIFLFAAAFVVGLASLVIRIAVGITWFVIAPVVYLCIATGYFCILVGQLTMLPYAAYRDIRRYYQNKREAEQIPFQAQEQVEVPIHMEVKPRRRRKAKTVNMVERNGVFVPENGEW